MEKIKYHWVANSLLTSEHSEQELKALFEERIKAGGLSGSKRRKAVDYLLRFTIRNLLPPHVRHNLQCTEGAPSKCHSIPSRSFPSGNRQLYNFDLDTIQVKDRVFRSVEDNHPPGQLHPDLLADLLDQKHKLEHLIQELDCVMDDLLVETKAFDKNIEAHARELSSRQMVTFNAFMEDLSQKNLPTTFETDALSGRINHSDCMTNPVGKLLCECLNVDELNQPQLVKAIRSLEDALNLANNSIASNSLFIDEKRCEVNTLGGMAL
eukprot:TRINITY_DN4809_c0_g3_i3.p1 TRINITY_DN4809_c0_g3~~TRINITY_DN4809_c0_g3_i3.p1  ORF type:complete len:266 (+),score=8.96 TRINITY_DN4809_c0_g3_i3:61-858(+)